MSQSGTYLKTGGGGGGVVFTLTGNTGGKVGPDGSGNINVVGSGNITVAGNPGTNTEIITFTGVLPIANGGTNASSFATTDGTVYYNGTRLVTTTTGTAGEILTSNGVGMAPTYQSPAASSITITGDSGGGLTGNSFTFTGGTTGLTFSGAGHTETLTGTLVVANGGTGAVTLTSHGVLLGNGTSAVTATAVGTNGQVLTGVTGNAPTFESPAASSITITGDTGGPLTGNSFTFDAITQAGSSVSFSGSGSTISLNTTDANDNTIIGLSAGNATIVANGGNSNECFGGNAGHSLTSGGSNCLLANSAGFSLTSGSGNVFIGGGSGYSLITGSNTISIGNNNASNYAGAESNNIIISNAGVIGESNVIRIGTTGSGTAQQNSCYIAGIDGVNVGSTATVVTEASDQLGTAVLTAGTGITITPSANTITIALTGGATDVAFRASMTADVSNVTGDNTNYTVVWDTTDYNIGGNFDGVSTFTAPITGLYQFNISILGANMTVANTFALAYVNTTSADYITNYLSPAPILGGGGTFCFNGSVVANMTAGDIAVARFQVFFSTKTVGIQGNTSTGSFVNFFSGYQIA